MATSDLYYCQSGKFKIHAPIVLLLGVGLCSVILGAAYGIGLYYCPSAYLSVFLPFGAGLAVGGMVYLVAKWTHIRNAAMVIASALLFGLILEYAAFMAWVYAISDWTFIVYQPQNLQSVLAFIAVDGIWEISGVVFNGPLLYTAWAVELIIILGCAVFLPYKFLKPMAYCETCQRWITDHKSILPFELIQDPADFKAQLERGEFAILGSLAGVPYSAPDYTSYDLSHCSVCNDLHLLSIETIKDTVDNNGKPQTQKTDVIRNLLIDAESMELIKELAPGEIPDATETENDTEPLAQDQPPDHPEPGDESSTQG
jgi:hypothetical protein